MIDSPAPARIDSSLQQAAQKRAAAAVPPGVSRLAPAPALPAHRHYVSHHGQEMAMYLSMPRCDASNAHMTPLLLVHSINAAASAYL